MGYPIAIGLIAFTLLFSGSYKVLERFFTIIVLLMSISFILAAAFTNPNLADVGRGIFLPEIPADSVFTILALVGTTVVPYNLFLHASLVNEKWKGSGDMRRLRQDTLISVSLGGVVSMSVIVASASMQGAAIESGADLAVGLAPLYGEAARYLMGIGLFAAGITSAITAPLAAAYVAQNCFNWPANLRDWRSRAVWIGVLVFGVAALALDYTPIEIIKLAQASNGMVLPLIAVLVLLMVNRKELMGKYVNSSAQNLLATLIIVLIIFLGIKAILSATGVSL